MAILNNCSNIRETGARFEVICKRCGTKLVVIRNWGGGIRREERYNMSNPATCDCGSMSFELY